MSSVAVLTGGGGILGRAMTNALTKAGVRVANLDRHVDAAEAACAEFGNGLATPYMCDITDRVQLTEIHGRITADLGHVDALINNAAANSENFFAPFEEFPIDHWNEVMAVNLTGPMLCSQVFGGPMAERGAGSIVNVLSVYGIAAPDQRIYEGSEYEGLPISSPAVYSASKGAVLAMTRHLATWWASSNVRVNAVSPGGIYSGQNQAFVDLYSKRVPMGRMAEAHEVGAVITFLLSDASSYMTGQNLCVDGGLSCW
jgi:NAD(P)-dependent dehydrogenase (short-subunit alcohol dehydrogenase family)